MIIDISIEYFLFSKMPVESGSFSVLFEEVRLDRFCSFPFISYFRKFLRAISFRLYEGASPAFYISSLFYFICPAMLYSLLSRSDNQDCVRFFLNISLYSLSNFVALRSSDINRSLLISFVLLIDNTVLKAKFPSHEFHFKSFLQYINTAGVPADRKNMERIEIMVSRRTFALKKS